MMIFLLAVLSALVSILWAQTAYAYLDPGFASMITATIAGGVAGLLVVGKLYWRRIRSAFGLREKEEQKEEQNGNPKI